MPMLSKRTSRKLAIVAVEVAAEDVDRQRVAELQPELARPASAAKLTSGGPA